MKWAQRSLAQVWSRSLCRHSLFIPEGPTAIVTPRELVLHERLRGGEKRHSLGYQLREDLSPGKVPPFVGDPHNSLSLTPSSHRRS